MSIKMSTLLGKVDSISNKQNASTIIDFHKYIAVQGLEEQ
jgi:hypothetical protein